LKGYIIDSPAGIFLLEKTGKLAEKALFPRNPKDAAVSVEDLRKGSLPVGAEDFLNRLSRIELEQVTVDSQPLATIARRLTGVQVVLDETDETIGKLRNRLPNILVRLRLVESKDDYDQFLRDVSMELARSAIAVATTKRDLYAIQTVRCIEDLDKTLNLLAGRIREWYGLHFPELDRMIEKHDTYARLVQNLGPRTLFSPENLVKIGIPQDKAITISEAAQKSTGAEMPAPDMEWLGEVCSRVLELYKLRDAAEKYADKIMVEVAPNMSAVLGAVLSAKIISIAGGLDRVAKMPASTLQVLGAEKALFRTLKTGARPPKHGIIFQYAAIHQAPKWLRGKIARAVAGKLAIAARMDAFGGANEGERFRHALDEKIKELKERYHGQPPRQKYAKADHQAPRDARRSLLDRPGEWRKEAGHEKYGGRDQRLRRRYGKGQR